MVEELKPIHGLIIQPSQAAQDLLAAFHLGAQTVIAVLAPHAAAQAQGAAPMALGSYGQDEQSEEFGEATLPDIMAMDPLRREALLSSFGLTVAGPVGKESDPTAANLAAMMEAEGIPTKPGPGGAVARYEPNDEGEID